ncbi:MAG: exonuclease domain-containing protein [bacterium]
MNPTQSSTLVWFDTEYTSLDLEQAHLIQVAMVITDMQGRRIAPQDQDLMTAVRLPEGCSVSDFVAKECPDLVRRARSESTPTSDEVDGMLTARLNSLLGPAPEKIKDRPILAGNTIHADWWFARRFLPRFIDRLHYRNLDVSTLKILWLDSKLGPEFDKGNTALIQDNLDGWTLPSGTKQHDALYDVMCSVAEMNYYRRHFLKDLK